MRALDLIVLVGYLLGTVLLGAYFSRAQRNVRDYFITGRRIPWWAIMGSIVATETSTVSLISVPGFAYGADLTFLQLVIGYLCGRVAVTVLFIPAYFRGDLLTVYELLGQRFGNGVRRLTSALFLVTRSLADGFRLFATGLVLAALLRVIPGTDDLVVQWVPGLDPTTTLLAVAVVAITLVTILYTFLGGMSAVIWTDVVQLAIYLLGTGLAAVILLDRIPGGWPEVSTAAAAAGKFKIFDFTWSLSRNYTFWSGVVGGAFLTTATHGTDQLMVQRYLCSRTPRQASAALLVSGVVVLAQFVLFLLIGVMLWVYYTTYAPGDVSAFTVNGQLQPDRILPFFIVTQFPTGVVGLVLAAVFAAAMSTLSSSLNSSSAALLSDFYMPLTRHARSDAHYLAVSRWATVGWGAVQFGVAIAAIELSSRVVDEVLGIASFTNGLLLGTFLLGILTVRIGQRSAFAGILSGLLIMLAVRTLTPISWQWYVLVGSTATFGAAWLASLIVPEPPPLRRDA